MSVKQMYSEITDTSPWAGDRARNPSYSMDQLPAGFRAVCSITACVVRSKCAVSVAVTILKRGRQGR